MRALIFDGSEPRLVTDHPEPSGAAGEAVIRATKVGVGPTELELCNGLFGFSGLSRHKPRSQNAW